MTGITTHVLDAVLGIPAAGIAVRLEKREGDAWSAVSSGITDSDGRCRGLCPDAKPGPYRLTFSTGRLPGAKRPHQHLPGDFHHLHLQRQAALPPALLLSDNSYTTIEGAEQCPGLARIVMENRVCGCLASPATRTLTISTSGLCRFCLKVIRDRLYPARQQQDSAYRHHEEHRLLCGARLQGGTIEAFAVELGDYLLANNPQVSGVAVEIEERAWERLIVDGAPEATTFNSAGLKCRQCVQFATRTRVVNSKSGVDGLTILKTTKSAFTGYIQGKLTTLKPATDRILGTRATVTWNYVSAGQNFAQARARIVAALLREFAAHHSMSVQHTLFDMGKPRSQPRLRLQAFISPCPICTTSLPTSAFGLENPNHIFVPIDAPFGYIEATIEP